MDLAPFGIKLFIYLLIHVHVYSCTYTYTYAYTYEYKYLSVFSSTELILQIRIEQVNNENKRQCVKIHGNL